MLLLCPPPWGANVGTRSGQAGHKSNIGIAQQIRKLGIVMIKQQCQPYHHSLTRIFLLPMPFLTWPLKALC